MKDTKEEDMTIKVVVNKTQIIIDKTVKLTNKI